MLLGSRALRGAKSLPFLTRVESVHDLEHGQRTSDNRERIENSHQADFPPTERLVYTGVSNRTARSKHGPLTQDGSLSHLFQYHYEVQL